MRHEKAEEAVSVEDAEKLERKIRMDDFTLEDATGAAVNPTSPGITLAPGESVDLTIGYANNDASQSDIINLVATHSGLGGELTIPVSVVPPQ